MKWRALRMLFQKASGAPVIIRLIKAMVCLAVALFGLLVAADNVIDYSTNFQFVQHVLSMDTIADKRLIDRAITDPAVWRLSYVVIIVGEALTGLCFLAAAIALLSQLRAPPARFERAKTWAVVGGAIGFLVWFVGFLVIGGEWFQMWQSPSWNGQQPAFRFVVIMLAVLIFITQREPDDTCGEITRR